MINTKTGAIVCKSPDERNQVAYRPLAFITGVPEAYTDDDFARNFDREIVQHLAGNCLEILFRADVRSTSNEVQEEFEKLHADSSKIPSFEFRAKSFVA